MYVVDLSTSQNFLLVILHEWECEGDREADMIMRGIWRALKMMPSKLISSLVLSVKVEETKQHLTF